MHQKLCSHAGSVSSTYVHHMRVMVGGQVARMQPPGAAVR